MARALILEPEIIIIDDALGNLDASVRIQLLNLTLDLQQRLDISYIYVGQDLGVIKHIADTVIVMDKGKMIKSGTPKTLFTDPQTDVTGRLVESYFGKILDETAWVKDKTLTKERKNEHTSLLFRTYIYRDYRYTC